MRVLFVTAEVYPLAKTGGLADVAAALPAALRRRGVDARILVPGYRQALARAPFLREVQRLRDALGLGETRLFETALPDARVPLWLVDCPALYDRAGGPYADESGREWPDNDLRFALLSHVAAGIAREGCGGWRPDIVHANDWHAALLPPLLARQDAQRPASVLTIHNLAYQGLFAAECFPRLGLPPEAFAGMEFYGRISFLKAGLGAADAITTVSPRYAREIVTPEQGCGLDGLLRQRSARLTGILNGVDYDLWDPAGDPHLACGYSLRAPEGKAANKRAVQAELGLEAESGRPLLVFLSRLDHQKAPDLVLEALPPLIEDGMQFAMVAEGDGTYEARFRALARDHPGRVGLQVGYEERLAHRLLAGADLLLHPSRFEPCGLVPIYAMRYGTVPVVHWTGGMADTVNDATPAALREGTATGFCFADASAEALVEAVRRAHGIYRQPILWRRLQRGTMGQDFGWHRAADAYLELYRALAGQPPAPAAAPEAPAGLRRLLNA